jgi:hypothetical protein
VFAAKQLAKGHAERCCERRKVSLVDGLAGLEAPDRPCVDAGNRCKLEDAETACDAKAEHTR